MKPAGLTFMIDVDARAAIFQGMRAEIRIPEFSRSRAS
jgi:hypothetical protein